MGQFVDFIRRRPIEVTASVVMIVGGAILTWQSAELIDKPIGSALAVLGLILSTLGGTLASYTAANFNALDRAAEMLRPQLSQANMGLANVTYQIGRIVKDFADGHIDSGTAIMFTQRAYDSLRSNITIYEQITGQNVEVDRIRQTLSSLDAMKKMFTSDDEQAGELKKIVQEKIDELRTEILSSSATTTAYIAERLLPKEEIITECHFCDRPTRILIGVNQGDTAHGRCPMGHAFSIHRARDGTVFHGGEPDPSAIANLSPYERIFRRQKVPLMEPTTFEIGISAASDAFSKVKNGRFSHRDSFESDILSRMKTRLPDAVERDAKDIWVVLYKAKVFRFLPEDGGIELREGIIGAELLRAVRTALVERVMSEVGNDVDIDEMCRLLSCDGEGRAQVEKAVEILAPSFGQ